MPSFNSLLQWSSQHSIKTDTNELSQLLLSNSTHRKDTDIMLWTHPTSHRTLYYTHSKTSLCLHLIRPLDIDMSEGLNKWCCPFLKDLHLGRSCSSHLSNAYLTFSHVTLLQSTQTSPLPLPELLQGVKMCNFWPYRSTMLILSCCGLEPSKVSHHFWTWVCRTDWTMSTPNLVHTGPPIFKNTHAGIGAPLKPNEKSVVNHQ